MTPFDLYRPVSSSSAHRDEHVQRAANRLHAREVPDFRAGLRQNAERFHVDDQLADAINASLLLAAPLLLTGEPGTGKTSVGHHLGWYFGLPVHEFHVKSTSTVEDLKYTFDAVAYLRRAYLARPEASRDGESSSGERQEPNVDPEDRPQQMAFTQKGPLWKAYRAEGGAVLLVDEIDKASRDFPNDLLHEFDEHRFPHPFDHDQTVEARHKPIVVVTSNAERRLPDAFLRRCVWHHIELTDDLLRRAVDCHRASGHFGLSESLITRALDRFLEIRKLSSTKPPGTAELLMWLAVLEARGIEERALGVPSWKDLPALHTLVKDRDDLRR